MNDSKFHTAQCGNYGISVSHFFGKNYVKATGLLNKSLKSLFDEIFFQWDQIFHFSTPCWRNYEVFVSFGPCFFKKSEITWNHRFYYFTTYLTVHAVWENTIKHDHAQTFREIKSLVVSMYKYFSKNVDLTEKMLTFP